MVLAHWENMVAKVRHRVRVLETAVRVVTRDRLARPHQTAVAHARLESGPRQATRTQQRQIAKAVMRGGGEEVEVARVNAMCVICTLSCISDLLGILTRESSSPCFFALLCSTPRSNLHRRVHARVEGTALVARSTISAVGSVRLASGAPLLRAKQRPLAVAHVRLGVTVPRARAQNSAVERVLLGGTEQVAVLTTLVQELVVQALTAGPSVRLILLVLAPVQVASGAVREQQR